VKLVRAAGGIVWRETAAGPRLAVVHRRKRDDWSLPKGRLDAGEAWQEAARRELAEETGCEVRLVRFAGAKLYLAREKPKLVLYWHAAVVRAGVLSTGDEIDEVAWLSRRDALERLDHASDRRLLVRALGERAAGLARSRDRARVADVDGLGGLVVVDSAEAAAAVPALLATIARAAGVAADRRLARRA
jgi:ADP-ribose pyrophosphatase YjhB (NUDIX family)